MRRKFVRSRWRVGAVFAVVGLVLTGCSNGDRAQARAREEAVRKVEIEPVRQETVHRTVELVGTLAAQDEVVISSQVEGAVSRILADLGDRVKAGQVLIELDREKLEYNYDQQKAALARALAKFGAAAPGRLPPIEQTPDAQRASAELVQAKQAFERVDQLHKRQLVPKQALDDADAAVRVKQASYESALQNAKNLGADIDASNASMKLADRQLRDASIRSPFDGFVQKRLVSLGEFVKTQTPVISVVRIDPLRVIGEIPEKMAPWIRIGQPVELRVDAYPDQTFMGKIARISPTVSTQTRAFPFEALAPNEGGLLKPGTFARVHVETAKVDQVLTLSHAAMQYRYGVNRVFVVNGDRIVARELKVGDRVGDRVEIFSGVKAGEPVVASDIEQLVDGLKVSVKPQTK